mgnify:CR=1 FL=1
MANDRDETLGGHLRDLDIEKQKTEEEQLFDLQNKFEVNLPEYEGIQNLTGLNISGSLGIGK